MALRRGASAECISDRPPHHWRVGQKPRRTESAQANISPQIQQWGLNPPAPFVAPGSAAPINLEAPRGAASANQIDVLRPVLESDCIVCLSLNINTLKLNFTYSLKYTSANNNNNNGRLCHSWPLLKLLKNF